MNKLHRLEVEADNGQGVVFACPESGCGRRVVVNRTGELVVVMQGDFYALHTGGTDGLAVKTSIAPEQRKSA